MYCTSATKLLPRPRYIGGRGIVFDRFLCLYLCLFVYIFVSLLAMQDYETTAGPIRMTFSGKVRSDHMGRPEYIFRQFRETARCSDAQHGDGVCCALAPQLVHFHLELLLILDRVIRNFLGC